MRRDVLLFGPAARTVGRDRITLEARGPTVRDALAEIAARHPELAPALGAARLAVNHALATPDTAIGPDDEVALIALLGGG
jgi:molybdopterin converting factor small subunit